MPRVGSSRISSFGLVASHLASTTFCWLPPLRLTTFCSMLGVRICRASMKSLRDRRVRAERRTKPAVRQRAKVGQADVLADRQAEHEGLLLAVFRHQADPELDRVERVLERDRLALDQDLAAVDPVRPEDRARQLGPAGADQAGQPDDLAGADREADVLDRR